MSEHRLPREGEGSASEERPRAIPPELPVLPLRDTVLFPNSFMPLAVAREASVRLVDDAMRGRVLAGYNTLVRLCIFASITLGPLLVAFLGSVSDTLVGGTIVRIRI